MAEQVKTQEQQEYNTMLSRVNNNYFPMIERQLEGNHIEFTQYAKQCVISALGAINALMDTAGTSWGDSQLDTSNVTQVLLNVAALQLNATANPRECYFQIRKVKVKDANGNDVWKKKVEMGIEGDGNDAILARFGRNIKKVYPFWLVRAGDDFVYPKYKGLAFTAPEWTPTGKGDVVKVVYPILDNDNTVHYYIAEREDVAKNLMAHINNNLMNETFGICKDRYNATPEQKAKIAEKKKEIMDKAKALGLDALDDVEMQAYISPAWTEPQSRETMIIRKMRNNIVKKIPKDFGNSFTSAVYNEATDESYRAAKLEIAENNGVQDVDFTEIVDEPQPVPVQPAQPQEAAEQTTLMGSTKRTRPSFLD